jgi:hypothetical protein
MIMICLRSNPEINALNLSRSNFIGALFGRARDVGDSSWIGARQYVTLNLRRHVCEIVGLGMRIPDRDHHCREYHGTQESHCNPSRVAIQSRNCLKGAGQSHRQCRDSDGATDRIVDSASFGVSPLSVTDHTGVLGNDFGNHDGTSDIRGEQSRSGEQLGLFTNPQMDASE